ncbi:hypothetical protein B0J14DRAFT_560016 [Halenospora varia]|nr:hypothetical protein B0J14DRAFT_560016 [Halenospora varia]
MLYKWGHCPKKHVPDKNYFCTDGMPSIPVVGGDRGNGLCSSYCEQVITISYGREVPFSGSTCRANDGVCKIETSQSVTTTSQYTINMGVNLGAGEEIAKALTGSFDLGASYSYSKSIAHTVTKSKERRPDAIGFCGYWTFFPFMITSCGVLTVADNTAINNSGFNSSGSISAGSKYACDHMYTNIENWCSTTPLFDANHKTNGEVVYVKTDCITGKVLSEDQDTTYDRPGHRWMSTYEGAVLFGNAQTPPHLLLTYGNALTMVQPPTHDE